MEDIEPKPKVKLGALVSFRVPQDKYENQDTKWAGPFVGKVIEVDDTNWIQVKVAGRQFNVKLALGDGD